MKYGNAFLAWLPLAVAITGLCLLVSVTVQQNYRQSLNDPQIQIAEDTAAKLSGYGQPKDVIPSEKIAIENSLLPWVGVYDGNGEAIVSSGTLEGRIPQPPKSIFGDMLAGTASGIQTPSLNGTSNGGLRERTGEKRLTWQPNADVRQALVIVRVQSPNSNTFVVAGRNMREVEDREGQLSTMIALAWLTLIISTLVVQLGVAYFQRR
jgi:hypothetical protein